MAPPPTQLPVWLLAKEAKEAKEAKLPPASKQATNKLATEG